MKKIYSILLGALALTALDANAATVQDIVGEYTCTQHQLYDYYWFWWQLQLATHGLCRHHHVYHLGRRTTP